MPTSSSPSVELRRFAEDPAAWGGAQTRGGHTRVLTDRYCLLLGPVPSFTSVSRLRLEPEEVAETLTEIRDLVATQGHVDALWWVGPSATPADLVDRLLAHGLVPAERPGFEPHATAMALVDEPPPAPAGAVARRVASFDEFLLATEVSRAAFGTPAAESAAPEERWRAERDGDAPRVYLAWVDGEPAGVGRALVQPGAPAVLTIGGGVAPSSRGRGAYRALVRARWDDAVEAGIGALTTQAGALSRPILERLGFVAVAELELLLDP